MKSNLRVWTILIPLFAAGGFAQVSGLGMELHRDIRYVETQGIDARNQSLDVYVPHGVSRAPVLVMVHGGGWRTGDKGNAAVGPALARRYGAEGFVFVGVNYRLVPEGQHPNNVQDVAHALAWVHDHIAEYGGDPDRIYLMGHSAGAHLAALVATHDRCLAHAGKSLDIVKGVVLLDTAAYDIPRRMREFSRPGVDEMVKAAFGPDEASWRDASPRAHVGPGKGIPPMLAFYTGTRLVADVLANDFVDALVEAGVPARAIDTVTLSHSEILRTASVAEHPLARYVLRFLQGADPTEFPRRLDEMSEGKAEAALFRLAFTHEGRLAQATALLDFFDNGLSDLAFACKRRIHLVRNFGNMQFEHHATHRVDTANGWGVHDFDRDGRLDLFIAQPHRNVSSVWLNRGNGLFAPVDLGNETKGTVRSVIFADFDGDGYVDSFHTVSSFQSNYHGCQLHPGLPGGRFGEDIIEQILEPPVPDFWTAWADHPSHGRQRRANKMIKGAVARDLDGDGQPDLILTAYADRGYQEDRFAVEWVDAQDRGIFILHNRSEPGSIRFKEVATTAIGSDAWGDSAAHWNAYVAIPIDYNRNGKWDLFVGAKVRRAGRGQWESTPAVRFFENVSEPGKVRFVERTEEAGFGHLNHPDMLPHINFASGAAVDIDNSGFKDLVLINRITPERTRFPHPFVFRNRGDGRFEEVPPEQHGLGNESGGRDLVYGDLNLNGRIDLVISDGGVGGFYGNDNSRIYENVTQNQNHWIQILAVADDLGSPAIGASIRVFEAGTHTLLGHDEVQTDFAYRSKRSPVLHFGLGATPWVDAHVRWRDGTEFVARDLESGRTHRLLPPGGG